MLIVYDFLMVSDNERRDWQVEKFANAALKDIGVSGFVAAHRPQVTGNPRLWSIQITTDDGSAHELEVEIFASDPDEVTQKKITAAVHKAIEGNKQ